MDKTCGIPEDCICGLCNTPEIDNYPDMPDELRAKLFALQTAADQITRDTPPGKCPIHGNVGFSRFMLIVDREVLSDHCTRCLSRVFTALIGVLKMPEEK